MNVLDAIKIKYSYVNTFLAGIVKKYQKFEMPSKAPVPYNENDKCPIWLCWWQGIEHAPELVKICVESMKKNFPQDNTKIYMITANNFWNYITLSKNIVDKFNRGTISMTHLSDIIRFNLLNQYGGMWIDATYYISRTIPKELFLTDSFYTQKFSAPPWESDIVQGKWSINLLKGSSGNKLFGFVSEALEFYWERHEQVMDYFLLDYIFRVAYENLPEVKWLVDKCPVNNEQVFTLVKYLNEPYSEKKFIDIQTDTSFYKLTYRGNWTDKTVNNEETFYGYLKRCSYTAEMGRSK